MPYQLRIEYRVKHPVFGFACESGLPRRNKVFANRAEAQAWRNRIFAHEPLWEVVRMRVTRSVKKTSEIGAISPAEGEPFAYVHRLDSTEGWLLRVGGDCVAAMSFDREQADHIVRFINVAHEAGVERAVGESTKQLVDETWELGTVRDEATSECHDLRTQLDALQAQHKALSKDYKRALSALGCLDNPVASDVCLRGTKGCQQPHEIPKSTTSGELFAQRGGGGQSRALVGGVEILTYHYFTDEMLYAINAAHEAAVEKAAQEAIAVAHRAGQRTIEMTQKCRDVERERDELRVQVENVHELLRLACQQREILQADLAAMTKERDSYREHSAIHFETAQALTKRAHDAEKHDKEFCDTLSALLERKASESIVCAIERLMNERDGLQAELEHHKAHGSFQKKSDALRACMAERDQLQVQVAHREGLIENLLKQRDDLEARLASVQETLA
ncbi:MAG: hypothetical protein ACREMY_07575, partial [bacterium]